MNSSLKKLTLQVSIAALYVVLLFIFQPLSFSGIQFRIAEVLLVLVLFYPKYSVGILIGTFLGNLLMSPYGFPDAAFGTLASGIAIGIMIPIRKLWYLALSAPVLINAIIIPIVILNVLIGEDMSFTQLLGSSAYWILFAQVGGGQLVVLYGLGIPFYLTINKNDYLKNQLAI